MDFKLTAPSIFPNGTKVGAYPAERWKPDDKKEGPPKGSPVSEKTVAGDSVTFTGLTTGIDYYAVAEVNGVWRYIQFRPGEAPPGIPGAIDFETLAPNRYLQVNGDGDGYVFSEVEGGEGGAVSSVFGRTGDVLPEADDYDISEISGATTALNEKASKTEAGEKVPKSLVDAKGDLLTATADNMPARLAVDASNGRVLTTDSTASTGLAYRQAGTWREWMPTGALLETIPGRSTGASNNYTATSGLLMLAPLPAPLLAGVKYSSISFLSATGGTATTHIWYCLVNGSTLKVLRSTKDDTGASWGGNNVLKTLELSSSYTPAADTCAYVGVCIVGSNVGTLRSTPTLNTNMAGLTPVICGESSSGLTTPLADETS